MKDSWYNVLNLDICYENLNKKYKYFYWNPPFWAWINNDLFKFIINNSTEDMIWVLLLPKNYDNVINNYWFNIIEKIKLPNEVFKNTKIETEIYKINKKVDFKLI